MMIISHLKSAIRIAAVIEEHAILVQLLHKPISWPIVRVVIDHVRILVHEITLSRILLEQAESLLSGSAFSRFFNLQVVAYGQVASEYWLVFFDALGGEHTLMREAIFGFSVFNLHVFEKHHFISFNLTQSSKRILFYILMRFDKNREYFNIVQVKVHFFIVIFTFFYKA